MKAVRQVLAARYRSMCLAGDFSLEKIDSCAIRRAMDEDSCGFQNIFGINTFGMAANKGTSPAKKAMKMR